MKCEKCKKDFKENSWESGITYLGIDEHHLHPKTLDNPFGLGRKLNLCRKCHIERLHPLIVIIVKKYSYRKTGNSLEWIWKYVPAENKEKCVNEVKEFTLNWVNKKDGNTKAT